MVPLERSLHLTERSTATFDYTLDPDTKCFSNGHKWLIRVLTVSYIVLRLYLGFLRACVRTLIVLCLMLGYVSQKRGFEMSEPLDKRLR
jgi:hypothetical protein